MTASFFSAATTGSPPSSDTIELTLLGPGYGEACVLHLPGVGWGVIDSCLLRLGRIKVNLPLEYLRALGVAKLSFVLLSHPHEDHFQGLDQIIESYRDIAIVGRYNGDSIAELKRYWVIHDVERSDPISDGLARVFRAMKKSEQRGSKFVRLSEMQVILDQTSTVCGTECKTVLKVLSPSGASEDRYADALRRCLPRVGKRFKALRKTDHNLIASAVLICVDKVRILLGSDVEKGTSRQTGWKGIVFTGPPSDLEVDAIKVAHHGASGAHHQPAWSLHKKRNPIALVTPFIHGQQQMPTAGDLSRISDHSSKVGITTVIEFEDPGLHYSPSAVSQAKYDMKSWKIIKEPVGAGFLRVRYSREGQLIETFALPPAQWHGCPVRRKGASHRL